MATVIHEPRSVLVIEDNLDDEHLLLRALRGCALPLFVRVARDGELGVKALGLDGDRRAERNAPDLIISDLKMPKYNGDEILGLAREHERLKHVPYVMFSSSDEARDVRRCLELGASAFHTKPLDFEDYLACVNAIARKWLPEDSDGGNP